MGKGPEETFLKRQHANGHGYKKKHSISLSTKEMQMEVTMKYHSCLLGLATVQRETLELHGI